LTLPLLPLSTGVVLPQMVVTLALETDEAKAAADAIGEDGQLLLVPRVDGRYARVGTIARVESAGELPNGVRALVLRGVQRAVVGVGVAGTTSGLWVEAEPVDDSGEPSEHVRELARDYRAIVGAIAERLGAGRLREALRGVTDPGALADTAGWWPDLEAERKLELLETLDVEERLEKVVAWARDALAELDVAEKIRSEVTDGMERQQREFLLRQQLSAIKKELGEDGDDDVIEDYRRRVAEGGLPEAVRESATREVDRLERTSEQSPEHGWIRSWLDSLLDVPWSERSDDNLDVNDARRVLDEDHTGLSDVKDRIVEMLAVRKLRAERGFEETSARPASARRRSASRWPAHSGGSSPGSRWAASMTRPRSAATAAPTSGPAPGGWSALSPRPAR
jgi:ATP-dependent Lon protease